jgi:hypothetical protein
LCSDRLRASRDNDLRRDALNVDLGVDALMKDVPRFEETVGGSPGHLSTSTPAQYGIQTVHDKDRANIESAALMKLYQERAQAADAENATLRRQLSELRTAESFVRAR